MSDDAERSLTCLTWNIHRGRGRDGRVDPDRILSVLMDEVWQLGTDALILQEADAEAPPHPGVLDLDAVAQRTGLRPVQTDRAARSTAESHGFLGVIVLLNPALVVEDLRLVDLPGHCPRGAVVVDLRKDATPLRLIATHLSLLQLLRAVQMRTLGQHIARCAPRQTILCGDLNEWRPWGGLALSPRILGTRFQGPALRSFPAGFPLLPLDRILTTDPGRSDRARILDGPGIRAASDHRPLWARITFGPATSAKTLRPA